MSATDDRQHVNNAYYDALAERWYEAWDDPIALLRQETEAKLSWAIPIMRNDGVSTVLDIGCGAGFVSNGLANHKLQVTGLDYSREAMVVAHRHAPQENPPNYDWGVAYTLPFVDHNFDSAVSYAFLEHVQKPAKVLAEA